MNNGKPRELHIQKALDVITFRTCNKTTRVAKDAFERSGERIRTLVQSPYFASSEVGDDWCQAALQFRRFGIAGGPRSYVLVVLEGNGNLGWSSVKEGDGSSLELKRGECWFIPCRNDARLLGLSER